VDGRRPQFLRDLEERYTRLVAEDTLREAARSVLGLDVEPLALTQPALALRTLSGQHKVAREQQFPIGTHVGQVYDTAGGRLLILGKLGSGRTTLLLDLALELLARARADSTRPLPVIFNLASWSPSDSLLGYWLKNELVKTYKMPGWVAHSWVAWGRFVPLLDGLDELDEVQRTRCVQAINYFLWVHAQRPLVVCSSPVVEYQAQRAPLALTSAAVILPLRDEQILGYLALGGESLAGLHERVDRDRSLRAALCTPFLLRLATVTYANRPPEEIPTVGDPRAIQQQVLQAYVTSQLELQHGQEEPEDDIPYDLEDTEWYLSWLASQMCLHRIDTFSARQVLQPDWLPDAQSLVRYRVTRDVVVGLEWVVLLVFLGIMQYLVVGSTLGGPVYFLSLAIGVVIVQVIVVIAILVDVHRSSSIRPIPPLRWFWLSLAIGLAIGLFFSLGNSLSRTQIPNGFNTVSGWLFYSLAYGLAVVVQHSVLRRQLRRSGVVPPRLDRFLEYAAGRMLLQRVSGGYRFLDVLLRDYFADLSA
jgi:hypothetical protein